MAAPNLKNDFFSEGAICPVNILSSDEVVHYRKKLTEFMDKNNWQLDAVSRHKPHLYLKWANDLGRHPNIINAIKPILGNDILLWYSVIFVKPPRSEGLVPWHQDSTYWALDRDEGLTVWLALSDVNESNGCVEYIPGSHTWRDMQHSIDNSEQNLLARGQLVKGFDEKNTKKLILKPGQASLHHVRLMHASKANPSDQPRLGIAFRYIPADNFPRTLTWMKRSATLVCGEDRLHKFVTDVVPQKDYDPAGMKFHSRSVKIAAIHTLFGDTSRSAFKKIMDLFPILITRKTLSYLRRMGLRIGQNHDS